MVGDLVQALNAATNAEIQDFLLEQLRFVVRPADIPAVAPFLAHANAVLLANHGVTTLGKSLMEACCRMEQVEQLARIMLVAQQLGRVCELPPEEVERLRNLSYSTVCRSTPPETSA